ncbi:MAG: P-II family nitrogen regulator [Nannocystales bacterium]
MKLVIAVFPPDRLDEVRESLLAAGIARITVMRCSGRARPDASPKLFRGRAVAPSLVSHVRVEVACNDEFVDPAIEAIVSGVRRGEGQVGDGKVFVVPLERCIRIRTGETGPEAV